jgi:hypothetical protein
MPARCSNTSAREAKVARAAKKLATISEIMEGAVPAAAADERSAGVARRRRFLDDSSVCTVGLRVWLVCV